MLSRQFRRKTGNILGLFRVCSNPAAIDADSWRISARSAGSGSGSGSGVAVGKATESRNLVDVKEEFTRQSSVFEVEWDKRSHMSTDDLMGRIMVNLEQHLGHNRRGKHSLKALDVACGTGIFTRSLASSSYCASVTGLDATPSMLLKARAEQNEEEDGVMSACELNYVEGDAASLPFENDSFDLVTCRLAVHHFQDPEQQLSEIARVCKPGGIVCVVDITSSETAVVADNMNRLERLRDPSHTTALSPTHLARLVETFQLNILCSHEGCEAAAISKGRGSNTEGVNTNPEERRNTVKIQTISGHTKHLPVIFNGMYVEQWLESTNTPTAVRNEIRDILRKECEVEGESGTNMTGMHDALSGFYPFFDTDKETLCFSHRYCVVTAMKR